MLVDETMDQAEPFDGLSLAAVDWADLTHAYGSAQDVPDLLRTQLSKDQAVRGDAMGELFNTVKHQGSGYEASAYCVTFLAHVALHGPGGRSMAILLITSMCHEYRRPGTTPDPSSAAVRAQLAPVLPDLAPLLRDPDVEMRRAMLRALSAGPAELVRSLVDLREFQDEDDL